MGTAIFMVLMVCGYWYTSRNLSTRFKIKRSFGWDVYFLVALYGCIFVLQGVIATGLMWLQNDSGKAMTWQQALAYAEASTVDGYSDWRLPNAKELQSIVDYTRSPDTTGTAAINPLFQTTNIGSTSAPERR